MTENSYRARIDLLDRRRADLQNRRLDAIENAIRLEAIAAERRIIDGHRRQAERLDNLIAEVDAEIEELLNTLDHGVAVWVDGKPKLPDLPPLAEPPLAAEREPLRAPAPPETAPPVTAAGKARERATHRRSAPLLSVLATASGRAGRSALSEEVHELEEWLDAARYGDRVEIQAVHAHRFADIQPAFEHRAPAIVHLVGRPRRVRSLFGPIEAAGERLQLAFLSLDDSLDEAAQLAEIVPVTIGSPKRLPADVKTAFAAMLYGGLAEGLTIADAFGRAHTALAAARITNGDGPRLFARLAANPAEISVVRRRAEAPAEEQLEIPDEPQFELRAA